MTSTLSFATASSLILSECLSAGMQGLLNMWHVHVPACRSLLEISLYVASVFPLAAERDVDAVWRWRWLRAVRSLDDVHHASHQCVSVSTAHATINQILASHEQDVATGVEAFIKHVLGVRVCFLSNLWLTDGAAKRADPVPELCARIVPRSDFTIVAPNFFERHCSEPFAGAVIPIANTFCRTD